MHRLRIQGSCQGIYIQESYRFLYSEYEHMLLTRILHGYWQEYYMGFHKKMIRFIDKISLCTLLGKVLACILTSPNLQRSYTDNGRDITWGFTRK